MEYAKNFPTMKCTLPANSSTMSKYALSRQSTMSESELKEVSDENEKHTNKRNKQTNITNTLTLFTPSSKRKTLSCTAS